MIVCSGTSTGVFIQILNHVCIHTHIFRQLRIKFSYVLELAKIKIFGEMKKACFPRY